MRKIIVSSFITLDGVMQAPGGGEEDFKYGGWSAPYFKAIYYLPTPYNSFGVGRSLMAGLTENAGV